MTASDAEVTREVEKALARGQAAARRATRLPRAAGARRTRPRSSCATKYRDEARRQQLAQRLVQKSLPAQARVAGRGRDLLHAPTRTSSRRLPARSALSVIQIPVEPDSAADAAGRARIARHPQAHRRRREVRQGCGRGVRRHRLGAAPAATSASSRAARWSPRSSRPSFSLPLGRVSEPVRTPYGWHLVEVLERDTLKTVAGRDSLDADGKPSSRGARPPHPRARPDHRRRPRPRQGAGRAGAARAGERHGLRHPGAPLQQVPGPGRRPTATSASSRWRTLQPQIRAGLDTLEVGQVSELLENQAGFNIFRVTERKPERAYTLDEIKDQLPEAVAQIQFKDRYDEWVKGLRAKAVSRDPVSPTSAGARRGAPARSARVGPMITFEQVTKRYGERLALDSVSWHMDEGECVVFARATAGRQDHPPAPHHPRDRSPPPAASRSAPSAAAAAVARPPRAAAPHPRHRLRGLPAAPRPHRVRERRAGGAHRRPLRRRRGHAAHAATRSRRWACSTTQAAYPSELSAGERQRAPSRAPSSTAPP